MIKHGKTPYLECSSKGDKRFSAFYAKIKCLGNRSIEEIYQCAKIFDKTDSDYSTETNHDKYKKLWMKNKGRKAINMEVVNCLYGYLWDLYIKENPELLLVIKGASGLSDIFGQQGHMCQATELWKIRNV